MREAPIILPVFTTSVPLDFPSEGTFAFNKKTHKQLEVTVRINEHQYFNMNFLNHDGYIMACCRWAHVLDFAENGYDRYEQIIKKHFRKKYPVISSLYGQHTDTAEDIHISPIGFEGNPKEWYISMRIYGPQNMEMYPVSTYLFFFTKTLKDMDFVIFSNALYFEIYGMMRKLKEYGFFTDKKLDELEKTISILGDKVIAGEDAGTERLRITTIVYSITSKMRTPLLEEKYHVKETEEGKFALELDGYIKKLIWRKWDTTYLEERMKQEDEVTAKVEADQALVKKKSEEWKAIMEGMSFNAFLLFHSKMNELMKTKKVTLVKYGFLATEMLDNHKRYWASSYYWHNKEYDEQEYMRYRKQTEIIVTIFYEGILRGTQYGNHPRTKYALKIHSIIEELMNKDWNKVNETLKLNNEGNQTF